MMDLFSPVPVRANGITGNFFQAQVRIHSKDLFTGLFCVDELEGQKTVFLFSQGNLIGVYKSSGDFYIQVPRIEWDDVILSSSGDLRVANVPVEGLRVIRLFLESKFDPANAMLSVPSSELSSHVSRWQRGNNAGLVLVGRENVNAVLLYPSGETTVSDGVLLSDVQAQAGSIVLNQVKAWGERPCQVMMGVYESKSEAWKEYDLRISFSNFVQTILHRYEELAGRFLVTDLDERVNEEIKNWGMALSLYGSKLSNRQFFETAENAGQTYVSMFKMVGQQMEVVIGEKMVASICNEAITQLGSDSRMLVQEYIFSQMERGAA